MTKKVTDTTKADPYGMFLESIMRGSASSMIEAQEARGQQEAVNSDQLPTQGLIGKERPIWEAMGIKIVENEPGTSASKDALFTDVELPKGWKKEATDHAMWNNLIDDKGRVRATFFYKAAFYDRDAFIRPECRFAVTRNYDRTDYKQMMEFQVKDGGKVVFSVEKPMPLKNDGTQREDYKASEMVKKELRAACVQWLTDNGFTDYTNPAAYWD